MNFDLDYLERLAKLVNENNLNEVTIENEDCMVSLKRELPSCNLLPQNLNAMVTSQVIQPVKKQENEVKQSTKPNGKPLTSPMVGTFYSSPAPDAPPFVKVGDNVSTGQVVCIIEAMKLMNEIEAEFSGKITQICVQNGESVEFGQVLMYVES